MLIRFRFASSKKPIHARYLLACAFVLLCGASPAQTLTAEQAVRLALERPEVRAIEHAEVEIARSEVTAARAWPNPAVRVEREQGRGAIADSTETSVMLEQEFDLSGRRGLQRRVADLGVQASVAEVAAERLRMRAEVLSRYHEAVAAEQRVRGLADVLIALDELQRVAARRQEAGDLSGFESQRIVQAVAHLRLRGDAHEAERRAAREQLAAWVGPVARELELDLDAELPSLPESDTNASSAEVSALRLRADQADAATRAAARWSVPVTLGIGQKRFETSEVRDRALVVEATLPLPLFDRNRAEAQRARAEADRTRARADIARRQSVARVAGTRAEAARLVAAARTLRDEIVPRARRLSGIAASSFAEGELDPGGLLETLEAQAEAVEQSIELQHRARQALIELETLTLGDTP